MRFFKYLLIISVFFSCDKKQENLSFNDDSTKLFTPLSSDRTNVKFKNTVQEDKKLNFINFPYIYNGGGVAVGDINNDNLPDLYFISNQESNKLYLNEGDFKFNDITKWANVEDSEGWSTGVTMVDINNDSYLDIYVCKSGSLNNSALRKNRLFINQKDNTFREESENYGLDDSGFSVQAYFFDFDLDNDLDMYLVNHRKDFENSSILNERRDLLYRHEESDQLYRNDNGKFVNITKPSGVANRAWGLSAAIGDFNNDSLPDIYVANDFILGDFLYINKGNGTFENQILSKFNHISFNSMGSDYADLNNDLLPDLVVLDMLAEDHIRGKENMATMSTSTFWSVVGSKNHYQYMSNMLQLNTGNGTFSEIGQLSGIAKTDWSWAPLIADFDNDGNNDLFVTNGIENDLTNQDFRKRIKNIINEEKGIKLNQAIKMMPSAKLSNYVFRNIGHLKFEDNTEDWGLGERVNSNGAVYSDLDNDGDLDLVINNQSDLASIYRNNSKNNSISFSFIGPKNNFKGVGVEVRLYYGDDKKQIKQLFTSRGFQSAVEHRLKFGLGNDNLIDSVIIKWPDGLIEKLLDVEVNKNVVLNYTNAIRKPVSITNTRKLFENINLDSLGINFRHKDNYFDDFKLQLLLPQKQSEVFTALSVGDVNNDGLDDFFVGNGQNSPAALYIQNTSGMFQSSNISLFDEDKIYEDTNAKFIDVDNDNDLDLYVTSGGYSISERNVLLQDRLYLNDGNGKFKKSNNLPKMLSNTKAIAHGDFDEDGDIDLFIGGRVKHGKYPISETSYLLENENGVFKDITSAKLKSSTDLRMVNDAIFDDFDDDGDLDLIAVGEWMPITVFENINEEFVHKDFEMLDKTNGWIQSITKFDFNDDGYNDYLIGNYGDNNKFKPTKEKPLHIYADYFDDNSTFDVVLSKESKSGDLLPVRGKECSTEQIPSLGDKIKTYKEFASLTLPEIYGKENLKSAVHYKAHSLKSFLLKNINGENFELVKLPNEAQMGPTLGTSIFDVNKDGFLDIIGVGNVYEAEVETIRYDASKGYVLLGNEKGQFNYNPNYSNFINSEAKAIAKLKIKDNIYFLILSKDSNLQLVKFYK